MSIWDTIGQPPERPPNIYLSDGSRNPERDEWVDRVGEAESQRIMKEWQAWFNREQDEIYKGIGSGKSLEDLGYEDAPEKGRTVFARYSPEEQARIRKETFGRTRDVHYAQDPVSGLYVNPGTAGAGDWENYEWRDATGNWVRPPQKSSFYDQFYGNQGSTYNAAAYDRPPGTRPQGQMATPGYVSRPPGATGRGSGTSGGVGTGSGMASSGRYMQNNGLIPYPTAPGSGSGGGGGGQPQNGRDPWQWLS